MAEGGVSGLVAGAVFKTAALVAVPAEETGPAIRAGLIGAAAELAAGARLEHGLGVLSEPYRTVRAGRLMKAGRALTAAGAGLPLAGRRSRLASVFADAAYLAGSLCTRFGVYNAGVRSTKDPEYVVVPQRERVSMRS